jgi:hypothetical protein|tara:strand:+ start:1919 stop:3898 length:1980 start_codon:yes stop_codon:yes gene_type:complete
MKNPEFLKNKYNLHNAPEVKKSAKRTESKTGEKVPQKPDAQIQNYLDRLERLILDPDKKQSRKTIDGESRPRALSLLREMIMNKYVRSNKEQLAQGARLVEERAAREMGMEVQYGEEELEQRGEIAVEDLEKSLDSWISYLSDANEPYPTWFRYYAFRNILDLGDYDKDKKEFTKRSKGSTRLFPEIDRGALAYVEQMIEASKDPEMLDKLIEAQTTAANQDIPEEQIITKEKAQKFAQMTFAKQYAEGMSQAGEITPEMREETNGKWMKYQKGTDPTALWASLQNKGTAWCTKGFATAQTQMEGGDFYVYSTLDRQGKPTVPRIAIRMQGKNIGEVRGVADGDQNLEGNMTEIAEEKMAELPGAEKYKKASSDMKQLTAIEKRVNQGEQLTKDDLIFLYEIDQSIEGFGYQRDPRIEEIRKTRNPKEDAPVVLDCQPEEIAWGVAELNENTKAYIGKLEHGIFNLIQKYNIEHVYTSFPEGKITQFEAEMGGQSEEEITSELEARKQLLESDRNKIYVGGYAKSMLKNKDPENGFQALKNKERIKFVKLKVSDLGFPNGAEVKEIYERAEELGLELCPQETGPQIRLHYEEIFKKEQPREEYLRIAMKQIHDSDGHPDVFGVYRLGDGESWLDDDWARPDNRWNPDPELVFRSRKFES